MASIIQDLINIEMEKIKEEINDNCKTIFEMEKLVYTNDSQFVRQLEIIRKKMDEEGKNNKVISFLKQKNIYAFAKL